MHKVEQAVERLKKGDLWPRLDLCTHLTSDR